MMKLKFSFLILKNLMWAIFSFTILLCSCRPGEQKSSVSGNGDYRLRKVTVIEVVQDKNSTFLKVEEGKNEFWMAVPKKEIFRGDQVFFSTTNSNKRSDFSGEQENDLPDTVLFVSQISIQPGRQTNNENSMQTLAMPPGHNGGRVAPVKKAVSVKRDTDGISISELYENKTNYANKKVRIKGVVVKINPGIMGRNWVHLQDGTSYSEKFDLTVTTLETVRVNDEATFEGTISLDKDFSSGYFYDVIMEGAVLVK